MTHHSEASRFVQAIPTNGDVIHALKVGEPVYWKYPGIHKTDPKSFSGRLLGGRSLCGVRGTDAYAMGGMAAVLDDDAELVDFDTENVPEPKTAWNGDAINVVCPRCVGRVRRILKSRGA